MLVLTLALVFLRIPCSCGRDVDDDAGWPWSLRCDSGGLLLLLLLLLLLALVLLLWWWCPLVDRAGSDVVDEDTWPPSSVDFRRIPLAKIMLLVLTAPPRSLFREEVDVG